MSPEVQKAYEQFHAAICGADFALEDILDVQLGFLLRGQVSVAAALTGHMKDQLSAMSAGDEVSYARLMSEAYRRTFADAQTAAKYGTEYMATDEAQVVSFFGYVTQGLLKQSSNPDQVSLLLDADTDNKH
jgi:hypothetical protein